MALTNKIIAIADAIREKRGTTNDILFKNMATEISLIPSSITPGTTIKPAASHYELTKTLAAIGNAIRVKTGGTETLTLDEMPDAIRSITYFEDEDEEYTVSEGLSYATTGLSSCEITGIGTCTDTVLVIPSKIGNYQVLAIRDDAFKNNQTITKVVIPPARTGTPTWDTSFGDMGFIIGDRAFQGCTNLETVVFGLSKATALDKDTNRIWISAGAFSGCLNLHTVIVKSKITRSDSEAFRACLKLKTVRIYDIYDWCNIDFIDMYSNPLCACPGESVLFYNGMAVTRLDFNDVFDVNIGRYAFYKYAPLISIDFGNCYDTRVSEYAFSQCPNLVSVEGVGDSIGEGAFEACPNLASLELGFSAILSGAFRQCAGLTGTVHITQGCQIQKYAFSETGMEHVIINGGPAYGPTMEYRASIWYGAFYNCPNLKTVTFLNNVQAVGDQYSSSNPNHNNTFEACPNLTDIYVPWLEGGSYGAPWGATNATIHYNHTA